MSRGEGFSVWWFFAVWACRFSWKFRGGLVIAVAATLPFLFESRLLAASLLFLITAVVGWQILRVGLLGVLTLRGEEDRLKLKARQVCVRVLESHGVAFKHLRTRTSPVGIVVSLRAEREEVLQLLQEVGARMKAFEVFEVDSHLTMETVRFEIRLRDAFDLPCVDFSSNHFRTPGSVEIGRTDRNEPVSMGADSLSVLVSGVPGSGKSVISSFVLRGSMDGARVLAVDMKGGVEFARFGALPGVDVATTPQEAVLGLRRFQAEMDTRQRDLVAWGLRSLPPDRHEMKCWVVVDELQQLLRPVGLPIKEAKALGDEARSLLTDLVLRGRATGIVVVAATQRPSAELLGGSLRDNFQVRISFRQTTSEAWRMALGSLDVPIPDRVLTPGHGLVSVEGEKTQVFRSYFMSDEARDKLCAVAAALGEQP